MIKINLRDWDDWHKAAKLAYPNFPRPRMPWIREVLNQAAKEILEKAENDKV